MEGRGGGNAQKDDPEKEMGTAKEKEEKGKGRSQSLAFPPDEPEEVHRASQAESQGDGGDAAEAEEFVRHDAPSLAAAAASACDILRPLSEVAAQRSILLPTSGSLAWLATHQPEHADRGQSSDTDGSLMLQSDFIEDATAMTEISDLAAVPADVDADDVDALREFAAAVWSSATGTITVAKSPEPVPSVPSVHSTAAYSSSSPLSSPPSSAEGSSGLAEDQHLHQDVVAPSPFASIFPDGTSTYPLFIQRCDGSEMHSDPDPSTLLKYSESIQLFRRRPEDGGKMWKRRVLEYR